MHASSDDLTIRSDIFSAAGSKVHSMSTVLYFILNLTQKSIDDAKHYIHVEGGITQHVEGGITQRANQGRKIVHTIQRH